MLNIKIVALVALQLLSPLLTQPASAAPAPARATRTPVVVPTCTKAQYLNTRNNTCVDCSTAFPGSSTCGSTGATACSYGALRNRQCVPITCDVNNGTYPSPTNGTTCVPCPAPMSTCTAHGQALTCSSGTMANGQCIPYRTAVNLTSVSYFTGANGTTIQPVNGVSAPSGVFTNLQSCASAILKSGAASRALVYWNSAATTNNCGFLNGITPIKGVKTSWNLYFFNTCANFAGSDNAEIKQIIESQTAYGPWTCHDMTL